MDKAHNTIQHDFIIARFFTKKSDLLYTSVVLSHFPAIYDRYIRPYELLSPARDGHGLKLRKILSVDKCIR